MENQSLRPSSCRWLSLQERERETAGFGNGFDEEAVKRDSATTVHDDVESFRACCETVAPEAKEKKL